MKLYRLSESTLKQSALLAGHGGVIRVFIRLSLKSHSPGSNIWQADLARVDRPSITE